MTAKEKIRELLALAEIELNGPAPWDIQVHDERFYQRALGHGSVGVGESYMDGWWDVADLSEFFCRMHRVQLASHVRTLEMLWLGVKSAAFNLQKQSSATQVARQHYDIGNDLYRIMLDRNMQYTCAYWKGADNLEDAQESKLHLICRKLQLKPGMRVLELGGGFCGLARFMAKEYGCEVVTYNISKEQVAFGRDFCADLPVRIEEKDYRDAIREKGSSIVWRRLGSASISAIARLPPFPGTGTGQAEGYGAYSCCIPSAAIARKPRPIPGSTNTSSPTAYFRPSPNWDRHGRPSGYGGLAQLRPRLRQDADGLVEEL